MLCGENKGTRVESAEERACESGQESLSGGGGCHLSRGLREGATGGDLGKTVPVKGTASANNAGQQWQECLRRSGMPVAASKGAERERVGDGVTGDQGRCHGVLVSHGEDFGYYSSERRAMEASEERKDINWLRFKRVLAL